MKLSTLLLLPSVAFSFDYSLKEAGSLVLTDQETSISPIVTLFTGEETGVAVDGLEWEENEDGSPEGSENVIVWQTLVDGKVQAEGTFNLTGTGRELPTSIDTGEIKVDDGGRYTITVNLSVDSSTNTVSSSYEAYAPGVSLIPLIVVLLLAVTTRMVELSLFSAVFVGACMVTGNVKDGFKITLDTFILEALADIDHGFVYLFTMFLSGMVGMMEKSGGMMGFTKDVAKYATTPRTGQLACFLVGCFVFFDDYANVLLAGETMRPLLDLLSVSREKLAFIVDATAAPVASISPVSSWVGFEVGLIQEQLDIIVERYGEENIDIKTSGLGVFLQSIKYRYYPIFMIVLMAALIFSGRDFGTMLIAERKTEIYERKDGGDGKGRSEGGVGEKENQPREDTPMKSWNMTIPVLLLIFLIFYLLVKTGEVPGESQSFMDKIENSDSYSSLLWGTMGATICTLLMYLIQIVMEGRLVIPTFPILKQLFSFRKSQVEGPVPRFLMSVGESVESFLYGMGRIFPALIVLTLAWASGSVMKAVGADRLFSRWIVGGISPESLPTLSFVISFFMALATGTSWGTMSILFPLILVPTFEASDGDATIFYAVTAGVLSGSVAGDHVSPISDTTVLSALACNCNLLAHVWTQAPYVMVIVVISIVLGTVPIGYDAWPNIVGILLGAFLTVAFVYGICVPVKSPTGRYDFIVELVLNWRKRRGKESPLFQLKEDTIAFCNGEAVAEEDEGDKLVEDPSADEDDDIVKVSTSMEEQAKMIEEGEVEPMENTGEVEPTETEEA